MRSPKWLASLCIVVVWNQPSWAQLSDADLAEMKEWIEKEGWTFTIGENDATQYPLEVLCRSQPIPGFQPPAQEEMPGTDATTSQTEVRALAPSFDWRTWDCLTPVKNQGGACGSCWAFASIGVMESLIYINDRAVEDLSEQWLVSCSSAGDCVGGRHDQALDFLGCAGPQDPCGDSGAVFELDFPYVAATVACGCPYLHPYCLGSRVFVSWPFQATEQQLKQAILDHGPIAATVFADVLFQAYTGGIFNACTNNTPNHAIVLVGWDDVEGVWILRNSWGAGWGEGGYMRIQYGCSRVGSDAVYATYTDSNWAVWVDPAAPGNPTGSFGAPYATLSQGVQYVADGGVIAIKAGNSAEALTITKAVTLEAVAGVVTIGQ